MNLELKNFETRTTQTRRPNFNNLINIQFDTLEAEHNLNQGCVKIIAL